MTRTRGYFVVALVTVVAALMLLLSLTGQALAQDTPTDQQPTDQQPTDSATTTDQAGDTGATTGQTTAAPLLIYFFQNGELVGVSRDITAGAQMVEFTVTDLLKGPTEDEKAQGFSTFLPEGLKMLYSTKSMTGNAFSVNLSSELMALKDTPEQAKMALQQLVQTLKEAAKTEEIKVTVDVDESNRGADAFAALGVNPKDLGLTGTGGDKGEKSWLWLYILIVLAATLVILAVLIPFYLNSRKAEATITQEIEDLEEEKSRRDSKKK